MSKTIEQQTVERAVHILKMLPDESDDEWDDLSSWEQRFIKDLRGRWSLHKDKWRVSEKQYEILERIYEKLG